MSTINPAKWGARYTLAESGGPGALARVPFRFAANVQPGQTVVLEEHVPRDGTIEALRVRIYAGAELALRIRPYIIDSRGNTRELIKFVGKKFLDGDDDVFTFVLREPVFTANDERMVVEAINTDATFAYDFSCDIEVDFAAGPWPFFMITGEGG
jgi:hypothetical protein